MTALPAGSSRLSAYSQRVLQAVADHPGLTPAGLARHVYPTAIGHRGWAGRTSHVSSTLDELHRLGWVRGTYEYGRAATFVLVPR